jgi:single-stranded DNA-binding protein
MSASVNKGILLGRLGKDPEAKYTRGGTAVARFSIGHRRALEGSIRQEAAADGMAQHDCLAQVGGYLRAMPDQGQVGLHRGQAT